MLPFVKCGDCDQSALAILLLLRHGPNWRWMSSPNCPMLNFNMSQYDICSPFAVGEGNRKQVRDLTTVPTDDRSNIGRRPRPLSAEERKFTFQNFCSYHIQKFTSNTFLGRPSFFPFDPSTLTLSSPCGELIDAICQ